MQNFYASLCFTADRGKAQGTQTMRMCCKENPLHRYRLLRGSFANLFNTPNSPGHVILSCAVYHAVQ
jgi:hypothetical protein